jgi:hypothetical protein
MKDGQIIEEHQAVQTPLSDAKLSQGGE